MIDKVYPTVRAKRIVKKLFTEWGGAKFAVTAYSPIFHLLLLLIQSIDVYSFNSTYDNK